MVIIQQKPLISKVYHLKKTSLDNTYVTCRRDNHAALRVSNNPEAYEKEKAKRRRGRFWQRAKTGEHILKAQSQKGWSFKFLTLTSSYASGDISQSFKAFIKRLKRYFNVENIPYIKVAEYNKKGDLVHLHIILYSPFIQIKVLREMWFEIHHAYEIFIERIPEKELDKNLGYLGKYLVKQMAQRFSYSRGWVGGLVGVAELWHGAVKYFFKLAPDKEFEWLISVWSEFIDDVIRGRRKKRFDELYNFMVVSTW